VVTAANQITAWYSRLVRTVEDMAVLAGAPVSGSGGPGGGAPASPNGIKSGSEASGLPEDAELGAALAARRALLLAWRAWYVALAYLHAKRFVDAAALLGRARQRALAALDAYRTLPGLNGAALPARAAQPGADDAAVPHHVALSGVCAADAASLSGLLDAIATRAVSITATGLLEQLAPAVRADADVAAMYAGGLQPLSAGGVDGVDPLPEALVRSARRQWLMERLAPHAALEATGDGDAGSLAPITPAPLPLPVKPILFDLAFNGVAYPGEVLAAPVHDKGAAGKGAAGGGGVLSWLGIGGK
jgi:hypothetical protein